MADLNPFSRREEFSARELTTARIFSLVSFLLFFIQDVYFTYVPASDHSRTTLWGNNAATPFAPNSIMIAIYWTVIFILQIYYLFSLFSKDAAHVTVAANLSFHFTASNLLLFGFLHLWVRSFFWLAELLIVINFFNLSFLYFRHSTAPRLLHIGAVSGPLAWNFVALYWVGARAVHSDALPARIVGNVFIWGFLAYGAFFLVAFKDYTVGFSLSYLSFATGVGQFLTKLPILQLQWIFAFAIGGLLFILSLGAASGKTPFEGGEVVSEDRERAPLLEDEQTA